MLKFRGKQLASGAVVNERMYYYVLDALDSNKDITLTSILGVEVSRCNDLTKENEHEGYYDGFQRSSSR